jgi:selenocysteine lyase/cysteine desulfurase
MFETSDSTRLAQSLEANKIRVACRGSGIRVSPHFFNTEEEIAKTVETVGEILTQMAH